jgi:hypothetical protein
MPIVLSPVVLFALGAGAAVFRAAGLGPVAAFCAVRLVAVDFFSSDMIGAPAFKKLR